MVRLTFQVFVVCFTYYGSLESRRASAPFPSGHHADSRATQYYCIIILSFMCTFEIYVTYSCVQRLNRVQRVHSHCQSLSGPWGESESDGTTSAAAAPAANSISRITHFGEQQLSCRYHAMRTAAVLQHDVATKHDAGDKATLTLSQSVAAAARLLARDSE